MAGPEKMLWLAFLGGIGACVGSFVNVVAYRLPRECMSIRHPRSRCPRCSVAIPWYRNIPVLSWLVQRGRCASCASRISPRYLFVELLCAALFVIVALVIVPEEGFSYPTAHGWTWATTAVGCLITGVLLALSLIDLDFRILPDEMTKTGIVLGPVLAVLAPALQPSIVLDRWLPQLPLRLAAGLHGILGALSGMCALWLIGWLGSKIFRKPAMGLGDVKMIGAMGGVLGFWVFLALAVAAIGGSVVGIVLRLVAKMRYIPFGPFLAGGMFAVMLWGQEIVRVYASLLKR